MYFVIAKLDYNLTFGAACLRKFNEVVIRQARQPGWQSQHNPMATRQYLLNQIIKYSIQ
jgi:hypothetical protein